jgi:hypothetical protein
MNVFNFQVRTYGDGSTQACLPDAGGYVAFKTSTEGEWIGYSVHASLYVGEDQTQVRRSIVRAGVDEHFGATFSVTDDLEVTPWAA